MLISSDSRYKGDQSEAEYFVQTALDALSAHVAILDSDGQIIGVNAAWRDFANSNGFKESNYGIGTNYLAVCDKSAKHNSQDAPEVARGIREVIQGRSNEFQLEYPCHSPKERRWFVVRISRFEWYEQIRLIVAHQNVSELKQVQIELSESKQRIEDILDNINNGIISLDLNGTIETANMAAARIFGYELSELLGMRMDRLVHQAIDNSQDLKRLNGNLEHETLGIRKDGSNFPIYLSLNELRLADGPIYTCFIQDITLRKRMESEIIERERVQVALEKERELRSLKNRFLSMMGHELNTPLASISLSYDMLKKYRHLSTEEENEQALDNIYHQVGHLRDMVKDVMTLSRSDAEGLNIDTEMLDFITYCRDVVEEFQFTYHKSHRVEFECEERDIRAQIDRKLLRRVFTNLLSNAIKYSPKGGKVGFYLSLSQSRDQAIIEVFDSGIGIPEDDLPRLFEAFHRASNADKLPGTGLGLAIVKQIVELHQGRIGVETKLGEGSRFIITIPLKQE